MADFPIYDTWKFWSAEVYIELLGGLTQRTVVDQLPTRRIGIDADTNTCTFYLNEPILFELQLICHVYVTVTGTNGIKVRRKFFTGFVSGVDVASPPYRYAYTMTDVRVLLSQSAATPITWSNRSFPDAVRDVLYAAGITDAFIGDIYDPNDTDYNLGDVYDIELDGDTPFSQTFQRLMKHAGTAAYVSPDGRIQVINGITIPQADALTVYADNPGGTDRGITRAQHRYSGYGETVRRWRAQGQRLPDGTIPAFVFTAEPPAYLPAGQRAGGETYEFAQTTAVLAKIARREVARRIRLRVDIDIEAPLHLDNPLPGQTIFFRYEDLGYSTDTPAIVTAIHTTGNAAMLMRLTFGEARIQGVGFDDSEIPDDIGDDGFVVTQPPYADFDATIDTEAVQIAGQPTPRIFVYLDASRSSVSTGTISYSWSFSGATATPASPTFEEGMVYLDTADPTLTTITLTVSDGTNNTQTSRTPIAGVDTIQRIERALITANGSAGAKILTIDGWTTFARGGASATAVPAFNPDINYIGWSDGALYSWATGSATQTLVYTFPAQVNAIFVPEEASNVILVGAGSNLYRSQDSGATFATIRSGSATINDVSCSPDGIAFVQVAEGSNVYTSTTLGASWSTGITGPGGSTATILAPAPWGNACCFVSAGSATNTVQFLEGHTVDWAGVSSAPTSVTAITPLLTEAGYVASSGSVSDLLRDGVVGGDSPLGDLVYLTNDGSGTGALYELLWNGSQFVAADIGAQSTESTWKIINRVATGLYQLDNATTATHIGYGVIGDIPQGYEILICTEAYSNGGVWHFVDGSGWVLRNNGLPTNNGTFYRPRVNPANRREWLVLYSDVFGAGLYHTNDAGLNWSLVTAVNNNVGTFALAWTDDVSGSWAMCAEALSSVPSFWRGQNSSVIAGPTSTVANVQHLISGQDNDVLIAYGDDYSLGPTVLGSLAYLDGNTLVPPIEANDPTNIRGDIDTVPGTRQVVQVAGGGVTSGSPRTVNDIGYVKDYRETDSDGEMTFATISGSQSTSLIVVSPTLAYASLPGAIGFRRITNPTQASATAATLSTTAHGLPVNIDAVGQVDRWFDRSVYAVRLDSEAVGFRDQMALVWDGSQWITVLADSAITTAHGTIPNGQLGPDIAVIKKGAG